MKNYRLLGALALFGLFSTPSHAVIISSSSPSAFDWSYDTLGSAGTLTGTGTLSVSGFGTTSLTLSVSLFNTSSPTNDRLTSFGFGIDPNATSVSFSDGADAGMIGAVLNNIPSLGLIEVCAFGGPNCSGGGNGGILGGSSDLFSLILAGTWGSSVDITPIGFKYQTDFGSFEFTANERPPPVSIPEPATLALMGMGLLGVGSLRRRRQATV